MAGQLVSAEDMRRAVADDPQFRCPRRPALVRGLVRLHLHDGILVEGAPSRQILRGAATRDLVPAILPLLDGTLDAGGIAERTGLPKPHVERVIALLYTCGLLEEGEADTEAAPNTPEAAFWSRSLDSTRVNSRTSEVLARLTSAQIGVAGDGRLAKLILNELGAAGMTAIGPVTGVAPPSVQQHDLVLAAIEEDAPAPAELAAECARAGVPFLPVRLSGGTVELGPYTDPEFTASFADAERQRLAAPVPEDTTGLSTQLRMQLAAALASAQTAALIARVGSVPVLRGLMRVDLGTWEQSLHVIASIPDQPGPRVTTTAAGVPLAVAFESSVAFTPRRLLNPRAHQVHYKPGNLALQHESKRWPSARELELADCTATVPAPLAAPESLGGEPGTGSVPLGQLAALLQRGAGLRPGGDSERKVQRWAPTGGNLGSVQLHVVARRVTGLQPGLWGYVSSGHRLARLGDALDIGYPSTSASISPAVIVLTGALSRVASKYYGFGWRVIHLDAGAAMAQLVYTAQAFGLSARPLDRWDDSHLAELLDLDLDSEPITGVLLVGADLNQGEE